MQAGYVAFLDVLGFSSLVAGENAAMKLQDYVNCIERAFEPSVEYCPVEYVAFSDSIVLTVQGDSEGALLSMMRQSSRLMGLMLEKEIALRGAISHGFYFRESTVGGVFVAGKAIIEAVEYETSQNWVGIMLAPSVIKHIPGLKAKCCIPPLSSIETWRQFRNQLDWAAFVQHYVAIPFHAEGNSEIRNYEGFAIVPRAGDFRPEPLFRSLKDSLVKLERMKSFAPDPKAQSKYALSKCWCQYCLDEWQKVKKAAEVFERSEN
jgi:hypothetical protein